MKIIVQNWSKYCTQVNGINNREQKCTRSSPLVKLFSVTPYKHDTSIVWLVVLVRTPPCTILYAHCVSRTTLTEIYRQLVAKALETTPFYDTTVVVVFFYLFCDIVAWHSFAFSVWIVWYDWLKRSQSIVHMSERDFHHNNYSTKCV